MLKFKEKIFYLEKILNYPVENYADSFKTDILFFIDEFSASNSMLFFLEEFNTHKEIDEWVRKLTSSIVLKFDNENEQIEDFIYDYIKLR